jgi:glutamate synthase (NADPH/NADH) large chain
VLYLPDRAKDSARRRTRAQDHKLERALDNQLIAHAAPALERGEPVAFELPIRNENRSVGAMLGGEVVRRHGGDGLPDDTIDVTLRGSAGQSFGAFVPSGITLRLYGDANDYVGKGLSGGRLAIRPDEAAPFAHDHGDGGAEEQIIAGNTILYGATGGELFLRGRVGERFAVRNSGARAVVEGVGDHGCEYMTGGVVVVLGPTGRNFAAGMSGGFAYVWQLDPQRVNPELVDLTDVEGEHEQTLHELVRRHYAETGSPVARRLLDTWAQSRGEFTAVIPRDYQRAVNVIRAVQAEGPRGRRVGDGRAGLGRGQEGRGAGAGQGTRSHAVTFMRRAPRHRRPFRRTLAVVRFFGAVPGVADLRRSQARAGAGGNHADVRYSTAVRFTDRGGPNG